MRKSTVAHRHRLLLAGCSLAPELRASRGAGAAASGRTRMRPAPGRRRRSTGSAFFPDPQLQALIADALEHNRDLRIAVARVAEARALYGVTRADRLPNVDLAASRTHARTPADLSATGSEITSHRYDVNVSMVTLRARLLGPRRQPDRGGQGAAIWPPTRRSALSACR